MLYLVQTHAEMRRPTQSTQALVPDHSFPMFFSGFGQRQATGRLTAAR